jgi:hypothetical protein
MLREASSTDCDRALHPERGMQGVAALERVLPGGWGQSDIDGRALRHFDGASVDERLRRRGDLRGGDELRRREAVAAAGIVDQVKDGRDTGPQLDGVRLEPEILHRHRDRRGLRGLGEGRGRGGEGNQSEKGLHIHSFSVVAISPSPRRQAA